MAASGQNPRPFERRLQNERLDREVSQAQRDLLLIHQSFAVARMREPPRAQGQSSGLRGQVGRRATVATSDCVGHRLEQRQLAARRPSHQERDDRESIDFVRAFEDAVDTSVTKGALDERVAMEAIAAVNLHALVGDTVEHLRRVHFDDGAFDGVSIERGRFGLLVR